MHIGGKVDIYSRYGLASSVVQVVADSNGVIHLTGPIYSVLRSVISGGSDPDTIDSGASFTTTNANFISFTGASASYSNGIITVSKDKHGFSAGRRIKLSGFVDSRFNGIYVVKTTAFGSLTVSGGVTGMTTSTGTLSGMSPENDVNFSTRQDLMLNFGGGNAGKTASFLISYFDGIDSLQTYLDSADNRVVCGDYLARGYNLYKLTFSLVSYEAVAPSIALCETTVDAYLKSLLPGQPFIMSDLQAALFDAGIRALQTPLTVTYSLYDRDCVDVITGTITDALNPNDSTAIFVQESLSISTASV
jgi:hypothetical protein